MTFSPLQPRAIALGLGATAACLTAGAFMAIPLRAAEPATASALAPALAPAEAPPAIAPPSTAPIPATVPPRANPPVAAVTSTKVIILSLGRREISLKNDGKLVGSWPVVIGAPETPTPTGTFKVQNKVLNPKYQSTSSGKINHTTGPSGPLGDRWMGFHSKGKNDFGIHGTPWPWWVDARAAVSHGCVRMKNEHVRVLFDQVEIGTPVVVKP
ncbi:L,D-transpeptidase [Cyanobium sp. ATX 6F1]|uniref:L,D-transpeptidase n=1 Tax=Cyanobium sp. ATX 6F1 TaxID=2823702 RepID=UPI0020CE4610|nr:L,D-transpeptidase [Cyanobium sp. ATX 6F1]